MKLIDLHKEWCENGRISPTAQYIVNGLCNEPELMPHIKLFRPTKAELYAHIEEGFDWAYWASGLKSTDNITDLMSLYSPLRQTIVLLICAMKNEL